MKYSSDTFGSLGTPGPNGRMCAIFDMEKLVDYIKDIVHDLDYLNKTTENGANGVDRDNNDNDKDDDKIAVKENDDGGDNGEYIEPEPKCGLYKRLPNGFDVELN